MSIPTSASFGPLHFCNSSKNALFILTVQVVAPTADLLNTGGDDSREKGKRVK